MKRYLVFYGYDYYPDGGMKDFQDDFDSIEDAQSLVDIDVDYDMWFQIYDTKTRMIVRSS